MFVDYILEVYIYCFIKISVLFKYYLFSLIAIQFVSIQSLILFVFLK